MFGYVVINKPELKIKDYDKYQEYYCGLCQSLKQNHGRRGQLTLNYDLNFVGILLSSLYEPTDKQYLIRCPLHPFHKKVFVLLYNIELTRALKELLKKFFYRKWRNLCWMYVC